jgi:adenine-specific DNA-methyltransferase
MPALKRFLSEVRQGLVPQTLWPYEEVGHTQEAKQELMAIVRFHRTEDVLNTVKPTRLVRRILQLATTADGTDIVLDFFAGSGTTGDAVIRQNREDAGRRRFLLVEMGEYFEDLILQRISRAIYAPEWKDLAPKREPTKDEVERTPRLVKVLRLEGYEDALHNLTTEDTLKRSGARASAYKRRIGVDGHRLKYLARLPLEATASMLNLAALEHPFDYTIEVLTDSGPKEEKVDLVETFNFLYGIHLERRERWSNPEDRRRYVAVKGRDRESRRVLVLWRDVANLDPGRERKFLEEKIAKEGPFDEVFSNGDSATPGVRSLDGLFKRLLEEGES